MLQRTSKQICQQQFLWLGRVVDWNDVETAEWSCRISRTHFSLFFYFFFYTNEVFMFPFVHDMNEYERLKKSLCNLHPDKHWAQNQTRTIFRFCPNRSQRGVAFTLFRVTFLITYRTIQVLSERFQRSARDVCITTFSATLCDHLWFSLYQWINKTQNPVKVFHWIRGHVLCNLTMRKIELFMLFIMALDQQQVVAVSLLIFPSYLAQHRYWMCI